MESLIVQSGTPRPTARFTSRLSITLSWLLRLRWGAVAGQTAMILVAGLVLHLTLPLLPLFFFAGVTALSNVGLTLWSRRREPTSDVIVSVVIACDTLLLTGLLYFAGGLANPFSVLYLVHVTLAALVLGKRWACGIVGLSGAAFAFLSYWHAPVSGMENLPAHAHWLGFIVAASSIGYFVAQVSVALRQREEELDKAHRQAARNEKLASLTSLAAGAAHELGTPLGTIAVTSNELERALIALGVPAELTEDARLIRDQVRRCRDIVIQMSARAGEAIGEAPEPVAMDHVVETVLDRIPRRRAIIVRDLTDHRAAIALPFRGVVEVVANLLRNALDASTSTPSVQLTVESARSAVRFVVEDKGAGIAEDVLARIGEPFFTTKEPGKGMGLGLFLAQTFADRWGGCLSITSALGHGTRVVLELPLGSASGPGSGSRLAGR